MEKLIKIPKMNKDESYKLISSEFVSRVCFKGDKYSYISPLFYIFNNDNMYFLTTNYGEKIKFYEKNPYVTVEIEKYESDFSDFSFTILSGKIIQVIDENEEKMVRDKFFNMIKNKSLSKNVLIPLGHSEQEPLENLKNKKRNVVWKLVEIEKIKSFKRG